MGMDLFLAYVQLELGIVVHVALATPGSTTCDARGYAATTDAYTVACLVDALTAFYSVVGP